MKLLVFIKVHLVFLRQISDWWLALESRDGLGMKNGPGLFDLDQHTTTTHINHSTLYVNKITELYL